MKMKFFDGTLLLGILLVQIIFVQSHSHHEKKLLRHLLGDYEPLERPVENDDDTVNVSYELKPIKISGLCVKKQTLFSHVWINMVWTDINLKWNPSDYGNIKTTRISPDKIWVPDIVPFQAENINQVDPHKLGTQVVVASNGQCTWVPPIKLESICKIDDPSANDQSCEIKLGSWTYSGNQVDITMPDSADTSNYIPNRKWHLANVTAERQEVKYDCCPEKYITIVYTFNLKKQGLMGRMFGLF